MNINFSGMVGVMNNNSSSSSPGKKDLIIVSKIYTQVKHESRNENMVSEGKRITVFHPIQEQARNEFVILIGFSVS